MPTTIVNGDTVALISALLGQVCLAMGVLAQPSSIVEQAKMLAPPQEISPVPRNADSGRHAAQ